MSLVVEINKSSPLWILSFLEINFGMPFNFIFPESLVLLIVKYSHYNTSSDQKINVPWFVNSNPIKLKESLFQKKSLYYYFFAESCTFTSSTKYIWNITTSCEANHNNIVNAYFQCFATAKKKKIACYLV